MSNAPTKNDGTTPPKDPGPSIDILVNTDGDALLVTDSTPKQPIDSVVFHRQTRRMAMFFKKDPSKPEGAGNVFPFEHQIIDKIAERLEKTGEKGTISFIVLNVETGQPISNDVVPFKII